MKNYKLYGLEKISDYSDDVIILREYLIHHGYANTVSYGDVLIAWMDFSNSRCASWLTVNDDNLEYFLKWLNEE